MSAGVGGIFFVLGILAGYRFKLASMMEAGLPRQLFEALTAIMPRISAVADVAGALASSEPLEVQSLGKLLAGTMLFGCSMVALAISRFEGKDF